jgi:hypothetical protein
MHAATARTVVCTQLQQNRLGLLHQILHSQASTSLADEPAFRTTGGNQQITVENQEDIFQYPAI